MSNPSFTLNNFDADDFLQNYWQKKPLLIKQALSNWKNPLSPEELAGLACTEEDDSNDKNEEEEQPVIESRLILCPEESQQTNTSSTWQLEHGPFPVSRFQILDEKNWSLLVQSVDHFLPEVAELKNYFNFLPQWRIDDVMVSYAPEGGSVGPHFDRYDVFLIQAGGQRRWRIGKQCTEITALQNDRALSLLQEFEAVNDFILDPGDILYLPPFYAHWGVSLDQHCMTYSVGFRAPSHLQLHDAFSQYVCETLNEDIRYSDKNMLQQEHCGEISPSAIEQVQSILSVPLKNSDNISEWFGRYITEPKYNDKTLYHQHDNKLFDTINDLKYELKRHTSVEKEASVRSAFVTETNSAPFFIFVNGDAHPCDKRLIASAKNICSNSIINTSDLIIWLEHPADAQKLLQWFNECVLCFED